MVKKVERESIFTHCSLTEVVLNVSDSLYFSLSAAYFDTAFQGKGYRHA